MIIDSFNRVHDYLRISLTDMCNLRCFYCMPEEEYDFTPASRLMQQDEIFAIAKIFVENGVKKIRLTGGEPFVRKDAGKIIQSLSSLGVQLAVTTNGTRLHEFGDVLEASQIHSINISLDTLSAEKFKFITRRDQFLIVKQNIETFINNGFTVKINVVVMKDFNDSEIVDFIKWTKKIPVHVRFIEFMPFAGNRWTSNKVVSMDEILQTIGKQFEFFSQKGEKNDTEKKYMIPGHEGSFGIISTMTKPFCEGCNRMRLTADGKLKNCLFSDGETDLLTPFRNGDNILPLIAENIKGKAKELGGQFTSNLEAVEAKLIHNRSMITIGG
ncbi:MAG: GTP 3',8-cyclase MoaA [Bacteroidota bacterium]|nr:GTP 3',8-cyclase MoaA [Bacteroidota bacterium]